jgi:histidinol-phosphate aminotransferase
MSKYWNKTTSEINPYVPGEQPKDRRYIKLNTNENPYPPSPKVIAAIKSAACDELKLYPDANCDELRSTVAKYYRLCPDQVFVGNGSDEVLAFSFMTFFDSEKPLLIPEITYSFYEVYIKLFNLTSKLVLLDEDFNFSTADFCVPNGGIVISNPNAPTTKYVSVKDLKRIIEFNTESVVIVDEAYIDFGGESLIPFINEYPNLLVIQTLSKSRSLAGLRVGFAFGNKELIEGLNKIKNSINSYTLDSISQAGAKAAFEDEDYFQSIALKVIATREKIIPSLKSLGFTVLESKANFIFISHDVIPSKVIFDELKNKGILVRYFNKPRIDNFLRISIGTDADMQTLIRELTSIKELYK